MCEVRVGGRRVAMPVAHMRMLVALLSAGGRVLSREELYEACGSGRLPPGSRRVDVNVARLRRELGPAGKFLLTVRARGYRLDAEGLARAARYTGPRPVGS
jgi:DNA-binding response OmpR family regulator